MSGALKGRTAARNALALLALLALALKILFPPGYMPGTDVSRPLMMCSGQMAPNLVLGHGNHHRPDDAPHKGEHPCPFAVAATVPVTADQAPGDLAPVLQHSIVSAGVFYTIAPGCGMAAPPPPSHAPPPLHA